ncbi:MAG: Bro-N domain-containing protein [Sulfuricellaceae bacterium]|nr:Bro-N domain-containing protein [Sulfuricellaceae bacterium]
MTNPSVFQFQDSYALRIVTIDAAPWFIATDIAKILEYKLATNIARLCDDDERGIHILNTPHGDQKMIIISQPGLFRALANSRSARAKPFQRWLFHDVLPKIMQTGTYSIQPAQPAPQPPAHLFLTVAELAQIKQAASGISRYFRFHLSGGISNAIYSPLHSAYNIERIQDIPADKLAEVLATLKDMEAIAYAYYMEASRNEREIMKTLGQKRIAA